MALHLAHTVYKDLEVDSGPHTTRVLMLSTTTSIPAPDDPQTTSPTAGVGLANVRLNQSRRRLLDLLNKLFNTG